MAGRIQANSVGTTSPYKSQKESESQFDISGIMDDCCHSFHDCLSLADCRLEQFLPAVVRHALVLAAEEVWLSSTRSLSRGCTERPRSKVSASCSSLSRSCHALAASPLLKGG